MPSPRAGKRTWARAGIDAGLWDEQAMAEVAHRSLTDAEKNEHAIRKGGSSVEALLAKDGVEFGPLGETIRG